MSFLFLLQLYAATAPQMENVNGAYFIPIAVSGDISDHARNLTLQSSLWDESVRCVKAYFECLPIFQIIAGELFPYIPSHFHVFRYLKG
jgi:hypothetical protein